MNTSLVPVDTSGAPPKSTVPRKSPAMTAAPAVSTASPAVCWNCVPPYRLLQSVPRQVPGQVLPSSQVSPPATMPSPQTVTQPLGVPVHDQPGSILQVALQPSALVRFPSSHVSPDPSTPSPHGSEASGAASSSPGTVPPSRATAASVVRLGSRPPSKSGTELGSSSSSNAKGWATIPLHATVLVARSHDRTAADWRCMA